MFAILSDDDGKFIKRVKLTKFTGKCSLLEAIGLSFGKLFLTKSKSNPNERLINNKRTFIVFDESEERLLKKVGNLLGMDAENPEANPPHRDIVKSILWLFIEDIKMRNRFTADDYIQPTYYPLSDGRYLPAYGIVRSDFVPEGGLPSMDE